MRMPLSHLVSDEKLVVDGEGHRVTGTEPPHWPVDGVSRQLPLLCIFFYQWNHIPLMFCYVGPSQVHHLKEGGMSSRFQTHENVF